MSQAELNQAILDTHSVQYAENSIIQSGGRITSAEVTGGSCVPASSLGATPQELATYGGGATQNQQVLSGFDININVVPANAPQAPGGPGPLPVPMPPGRESDAGSDE